MSLDQLLAAAKAWAAQDPDPVTRAELEATIASANEAELHARMGSRLGFGTAGLRGELGAGSNRMNRVLVSQAALGIANYLNKKFATPSVIIGYDGRVNSDVFAKDSAEIFAAAGIRTVLFDDFVPTPVLAFSVKQGEFSAGIMVTASHNPPRDNGYKVYLGGSNGGSQIVPPTDAEIAAEIDRVAASETFDSIAKSSEYSVATDEYRAAYLSQTAMLVAGDHATGFGESQPKIVFTAMHGVGWATVARLFDRVGLNAPVTVNAQIDPDGSFPTVAFPNPEEPGALDLSFETARMVGADLILANDPDADRLAVAIRSAGDYRKLTGDELGLVLAHELAGRAAAAGKSGTLACSLVSSSALGKVAAHFGFDYRETLTGFKWIAKVPNLIFGFEEALGYCVDPQHTPDKDGISAALVVAKIANDLHVNGSNLEQHLAELAELYGSYATGQISIRVSDLSLIANTMQRLRDNLPTEIDGIRAKFTDLNIGSAVLPATDGLRFDLADERRVIIRPSGTEPKLKCYLQAVGANDAEAKSKLAALDAAMRELLK